MDINKQITEFPVTVFGKLEPFNDTISKARVRIFYKGANRNGSYITDEFATLLLSSIPYAPIKGIYSIKEQDFGSHGTSRDEGRVYGVVAAEPNVTWEKHTDEDGVEREYACVDALIYTALYQEATEIIGKSQSMELYRPSISGDWKEIDGKSYFVFSKACFLGLQVLGDSTEPCFEGAAFFSLFDSLKSIEQQIGDEELSAKLSEVAALVQEYELKQKQGGVKMPQDILFKLSFDDIKDKLFRLLNPIKEDGYCDYNYSLCCIYDDYAVVLNYEQNGYERIYYTKDDANDTLEIVSREPCFLIDVNGKEKAALDSLRTIASSYEELAGKFAEAENLTQQLDNKKAEFEELNSTLSLEREQFQNELKSTKEQIISEYEQKIAEMTATLNELANFKAQTERNAKMNIINSYGDLLNNDIIDKYTKNIDQYNEEELDMRLTYELKKANIQTFKQSQQSILIPKEQPLTGLEAILAPYRDRK